MAGNENEADQRDRAQARSRQYVGRHKAVQQGQRARGGHGFVYVVFVVGTASALAFALSGVIADAPWLAYLLGAFIVLASILALRGRPPLLRRMVLSHRGIVGLALAIALTGSLYGLTRAENRAAEMAAEMQLADKNAAAKLAEERRHMAAEAARQDRLRAQLAVDLFPMKELSNKLNGAISSARWEVAWRLLEKLDALSKPYTTVVGLPQDTTNAVGTARSAVSVARGALQARATIARTTRLLVEGQQLQRASDRERVSRASENFSQIIRELRGIPPAYTGYAPELAEQLAKAEKLDGQVRDELHPVSRTV